MIKEEKRYYIICDNCNEAYLGSSYLCKYTAMRCAKEDEWIEHNGKHYCPNCYELDDNDNIVIKEREVENEH